MWTSSNRFSVQPSQAWIHCSTPQSEGERDGYCRQNCRQSPDRGAFPTMESTAELCAPEEIRTPNLLIRSQMLYPLSYGRMSLSCMADESASAEARGFEPPVAFEGDNSLAVSPIRPLWHAS